ncbi:MAG: Cytochrome b561 [Paracidovorax wautersii]|uniref:Cytochrome b561 n=1 Tax=Paracidovorax wautersii TaxID=1177982 RepID=A0A7V8FLK4_9BURK|nr:MAG: Cytochrome b561 [Paracidovorax wautersii]
MPITSSSPPAARGLWRDTTGRFGRISRWLHWTMALLFLWQFTGMALKEMLGRTPVSAFFVGTHRDVGVLLFTLLLVRAAWGLYNLGRRPPHQPGVIGALAVAGHLALYGLMFIVPSLALLRQYGSGRAFAPFGVPLMGASEPVAWMVAPANAAHGLLAWLLLALIVGHVAMVLVHRFVWRDAVARRMVGRVRD